MAVDGDIKLSVDLEPGDITSAASELQERIRAIFENSAGEEVSQQFQSLQVSMASSYDKATRLQDAMAKLGSSYQLTPDAKKLDDAIQKIIDKQAEVNKKLDDAKEKLSNMPSYVNTDTYANLQDQLIKLGQIYSSVSDQVQHFKEEYEATGDTNIGRKYLVELGNLHKIGVEIDSVEQKMQKMRESGTAFVDNNRKIEDQKELIENLNQEYITLENELIELTSKMEDLESAGKAKVFGDQTDEYERLKEQLTNVVNRLNLYLRKIEEVEEGTENTDIFGNLVKKNFGTSIIDFANNINQLPKMVEGMADDMAKTVSSTLPPAFSAAFETVYSIAKAALKYVINEFITTAKQLASISVQVAKQIANTLKNVLIKAINSTITAVKSLAKALASIASKVILSPFQKIADAVGNIGKKAESATPNIKQIGRAFLQYGIGARSLYRLINKLRTALFEGFSNLALAYEPFNDAMSRITTALEYLKNSFAAAFAPIIEYVAPALSMFITKVAEAVQWVGQLIAALTGKEFVMAMPVWKSYADTTSAGAAAAKEQANADKNAAKAAKDAAKAEAKRNKQLEKYKKTIAGFDDVELLKVPDETDSATDGITTPNTYDFSTPTLDAALQKFKVGGPIQSGIKQFADLLKKAWKTADAYDLGQLMSKKLGDLLRTFNANIPKIQAVLGRIARIIASFLAGFLSIGDTFKVLGLAIANVINTIFKTLQEFLKTFMNYDGFKNLGKDIYYTIVNALQNIDWETIYDVFRMMGQGIAQVLNETIAKPDFWILIFRTLTNALRAILIRIIAFSRELHWGEIGSAIAAGINEGIRNFPVQETIDAITSFFGGLWHLFVRLVTETHWGELGKTIASIIVGVFSQIDPYDFAIGLLAFLNGLLTTFKTLIAGIPWADVGTGIATFIITTVEHFPVQDMVNAISAFLSALWTAFINFVNRMKGHWDEIGRTVALLIIGLFKNFEPVEFANGVIAFLDGLWDAFMGFVETPGWGEVVDKIGTAIATFLANFKWEEKANDLFKFLNKAVKKLKEQVDKIDLHGLVSKILNYLSTNKDVQEMCANIVNIIIEFVKAKIEAKGGLIKILGKMFLGHMFNGINDNVWSNAEEATKKELEAFGIEFDKMKRDAENLGVTQGDTIGAGVSSGIEGQTANVTQSANNLSNTIVDELKSPDYGYIWTENNGRPLVTGIDNFRPETTGAIKKVSDDMVAAFESGDYETPMRNNLNDVTNGIKNNKDGAISEAQTTASELTSAFTSGDYDSAMSDNMRDLGYAISNNKTNAVSEASLVAEEMYGSFNSQDWNSLGGNMLDGIGAGMDSGWDNLATKAWNLAVDLYNEACRALGIASPSKVFRDKVGEMIPAGIGIGIEANADSALGAVSDLSDGLVNTAKNIKIPPIAMGEVIPYSIANNQDGTQTALNTLANMIQSLQSNMVTEESLNRAITNVIANMPDFYIGQEKLARIVKQGNSMLDRRYGY